VLAEVFVSVSLCLMFRFGPKGTKSVSQTWNNFSRPFRFYITLSGQTLTGREATKAAEKDKEAVKQGLGPAAKDRSMIMR